MFAVKLLAKVERQNPLLTLANLVKSKHLKGTSTSSPSNVLATTKLYSVYLNYDD